MAHRSAAHQCINIINDMYGTLNRARRAFMGQDSYIISKTEMLEQLDLLRSSLPDALSKAVEYVKEYDNIITQTNQECNAKRINAEQTASQTIADANQQASETIASANRQAAETLSNAQRSAQETIQKATQEATAIMEGARAEAQRVLAEAAAKAEQMVEEEDVLCRARAAASEVTADTQAEMTRMRQMTFDYLDGVMDHIDRCLSETLSDLRMERGQLNNHR